MKWHEIPKVQIQELYNEDGEVLGVLLKAKDFEKLVEKMEDFLDIIASSKVMRSKEQKYYTHAEILKLIDGKKK